jgi:hypothetical protein
MTTMERDFNPKTEIELAGMQSGQFYFGFRVQCRD